MFATFRKYQKWIYIGAMIVVIPSFVVFFTPGAGRGGGGGQANVELGYVDGKPVTREEYLSAHKEVALRYRLRYGAWPDDARMTRFNLNLAQEAMTQIALLHKLGDAGIKVGDEAVAEQIHAYFKDADTGAYDPAKLQNFLKNLAAEKGYSEDEFFSYIRHQVGIQHLAGLYALGGDLVPPRAGEADYRRDNQQLVTEAVFFHSTNFVDKVVVNTNDLAQYYTNQLGRYRIPVRVEVHYVAFDSINYLTEAAKQLAQDTNLTVKIEKYYIDRGTNTFTDKDGKVMSPEAAKEKIKEDQRKSIATTFARREAAKFARTLEDIDNRTVADFQKVAAANKFAVKSTAPFTIADGPAGLNAPPEFARSAFALTQVDPVALKPIVGEDAVYVIALKDRLKEVNQPLEAVLAKVTADYREQESLNLMHKAAEAAYSSITNGMAAKKSFVDVAKAEKLVPVTFAPFAKKARSSDEISKYVSFFTFQDNAWNTDPGKVSGPFPSGDSAFILHVLEKKNAPADGLAAELPKLMESVRDAFKGMAENDWVQKQTMSIQMPVNSDAKKK